MEELKAVYGVTPESLGEAMQSRVKGWLREEGGKVVGFSMGDRSNGEVQVVEVLPDCEGRGIGRRLLERVQDRLYAAGHEAIWLFATPDPKVRPTGLYRKHAWQRTGG